MESPKRSPLQRTLSEGRSNSEEPLSPRSFFYTINERPVDDISLELFYKPHTLTLLAAALAVVFYIAFTRDSATSREAVCK